jgi:hyperosmotically inducible protein
MRIALLFSLVLAAAACDNKTASSAPADSTGVNERDRDTVALTPTDQGENEIDRTITRKVRQGVMKNDSLSLSITAKNVKIIAMSSVVTLRGPVKNDEERSDIVTIARAPTG